MRKKIHYGWVMLAFAILSAFIFVGLCSNTVSLYVQPVSAANNFPRGLFTIKNSAASIIAGVIALCFGKISARFSLKKIIVFGSINLILCYFVQAVAKTLPMFYVSAVFQGIGTGCCSMTVLTLILNRWFSAKFGTLFGAIYTATSVGGALFFPVIGNLISAGGYARGFILTIVLIAVYLGITLLLFSESPAEKHLTPIYSDQAEEKPASIEDEPGITYDEIKKKPVFYISLFLILISSMAGGATQGTMTARLTDVGFSLSFATSIVSILYVFTSLSKIPAGILADKKGILPVLIISMTATILALVFLIVVRTPFVAYLMTPFMGVTMVLFTVPVPLMGPTLFGRKALTQYSGLYVGAQTLGMAIGQTLFNFMYDASGSYVSSYILCIVIMVVSMAAFVLILKDSYNWLLPENGRSRKQPE